MDQIVRADVARRDAEQDARINQELEALGRPPTLVDLLVATLKHKPRETGKVVGMIDTLHEATREG
jgi:hypothetical protein